MRWFWRVYWPVAVIILGLVFAWPNAGRIEEGIHPIVLHSVAPESVARLPDNRLCWAMHLAKLRDAEPWNLDVFLDRPWRRDRSFPEISDRYTRVPLHTASALKAGETRDQDQCVDLPPDLAPGEPITLAQVVHYRGFRGWWDLTVEVLSISYTVPGGPVTPAPPAH